MPLSNRTYLTLGDIRDVRDRLWQRRSFGFLQKLWKDELHRTSDTFDHTHAISIWNMVPEVRARLNFMATGDPNLSYEPYTCQKYFAALPSPSLLSIGCGVGSHELAFAANSNLALVHGIDLAPTPIAIAQKMAAEQGLSNVRFEVKDFLSSNFDHKYDAVLFHQSLHHFADFDRILGTFLPAVLKPGGILIINEFVGPTRLQWTASQLQAANHALHTLPKSYRRIFKTPFHRHHIHRPGWWRMLASDPSESINSSDLLPAIHRHLHTLEEHSLGGNLLHLVLKDIAHHFCDGSKASIGLLQQLFALEDAYLASSKGDYIFGVYALHPPKSESSPL